MGTHGGAEAREESRARGTPQELAERSLPGKPAITKERLHSKGGPQTRTVIEAWGKEEQRQNRGHWPDTRRIPVGREGWYGLLPGQRSQGSSRRLVTFSN